MSSNLLGYGIQLVLAVGVMLGMYALIRTSLRDLLDQVLKLPAATVFYLRSLLLILVFAALSKAVEDKFEHAADAAFMVYVWDVAGTLGDVLELSLAWFLVYLVQITILTAVLRRKNGQ